LGAGAPEAHREVGRCAAEIGVDALFALGDHAALFAQGALEGGLGAHAVHRLAAPSEAVTALRATLREGDWVLLKGSRSMRMERVLVGLQANGG
jgi:UDP-N-acetylmuramoyl-tripeptide--D-alanyl-D-alanine ligase